MSLIKFTSLLLVFSTVASAGVISLFPRNAVSPNSFSSISKRQDVPSVGDACPIPGSSANSQVCAVTQDGDTTNTQCAEVCCTFGGVYRESIQSQFPEVMAN